MPAYSFKIPSQLQLQGSSYTFSYKFLKAINVKKKVWYAYISLAVRS